MLFLFLAPQQQVIVPDSKLIPHMNASGMVRKAEVYTSVTVIMEVVLIK